MSTNSIYVKYIFKHLSFTTLLAGWVSVHKSLGARDIGTNEDVNFIPEIFKMNNRSNVLFLVFVDNKIQRIA